MQLSWFGTNQRRFGHQVQSDWLFGWTFILDLSNNAKLIGQMHLRLLGFEVLLWANFRIKRRVLTIKGIAPTAPPPFCHATNVSANYPRWRTERTVLLTRIRFLAAPIIFE